MHVGLLSAKKCVFTLRGFAESVAQSPLYLIQTTTARDLTDAQNRLIQIESHINKLLGIY